MRRPVKGGTSHPPLQRPGMGYGRPLRPQASAVTRAEFDAEMDALLRGEPIASDRPVVVDDRSSVTGLDLRS